jgi:hypothetical protein
MLPSLNILITNNIQKTPEDGVLVYKYAPLKNLKNLKGDNIQNDLVDMNLPSVDANIDINSTIDILTEPSYDGSVNLIINDRKNYVKLINTRFYLTSSYTYKIADRKGNIDNNIYNYETFKSDVNFIKTAGTIVTLDFLGIKNGGIMPVGNYNFFFKLADADGNESDFVSESGKVVCHVGSVNNPSSIRGGQLNENSNKSISFTLNNLDVSYDYINIYYTKTTGSQDSEIVESFKIADKIKILGKSTTISITGYENHLKIPDTDINTQYSNFESVKTLAICQNITFAGGVTKDYEIFRTLEKYSLFITPSIAHQDSIGNLDYSYSGSGEDKESESSMEYFNVRNIYYSLGY